MFVDSDQRERVKSGPKIRLLEKTVEVNISFSLNLLTISSARPQFTHVTVTSSLHPLKCYDVIMLLC